MMKSLKTYLKAIEEYHITPNFFISEPYLELCDIDSFDSDGWLWIEEEGTILFPPLPDPDRFGGVPVLPSKFNFIWADFPNYSGREGYKKEELDWEYVYDPMNFRDMTGGRWQVFRKNSRKWPRANPNYEYTSQISFELPQAHELIANWLEKRASAAQDPELMAHFAIFSNHPGIRRKFLLRDGELVGINAWDENYHYLNYRICFTKDGERFLDEFLRLKFYRDPDVLSTGKLVNDGGSLGNSNLERFKDKLNPKEKRKIYSLRKK